MKPIKVRFVGLIFCSLITSCVFYNDDTADDTTIVIPDYGKLFLKENTVESYKLLADFPDGPYDFAFTPSGWRIISYTGRINTIPYNIIYRTEKARTSYPFFWPQEYENRSWEEIDRLIELNGKLYLDGWVEYPGGRKSSFIFAYDTLTQKAEALYSDTFRLRFMGTDSVSIYFTTDKKDRNFRFDIAEKSLGNSPATSYSFEDTSHFLDGYLISTSGDSIFKIDTASGRRLWETVLPSQHAYQAQWIHDLTVHDGCIYACGDTGFVGSRRAFAVKLDRNGAVVWQNTFGGTERAYDETFHKIAIDPAGNLVCIGSMGPRPGIPRYLFLASINRDGEQIKQSIISNNPGRESSWGYISIAKIEKVEAGLIHVIIMSDEYIKGNYAQITY
jgi:hypothetical protein